MAYTKTTWVNGTTPAINATNLNKIEDGIFNNDAAITALDTEVNTGWLALGTVITFESADAPNYVVNTASNMSGVITLGMRIKLTHAASTKYFLVVAVSGTQLTLYGGTDYALSATAITNPFFSSAKAPFGFPLDADKWTQSYVSSTSALFTPTNGVWSNPGGNSLSLPIGSWRVRYAAEVRTYTTATVIGQFALGFVSLSTATNADNLTKFRMGFERNAPTTGTYGNISSLYKEDYHTVTSKTTLYLIYKLQTDMTINPTNGFSTNGTDITIKATSAYL